MSSTPIAEHALLSDRHSSSLVTTAGSVDWLSFPAKVTIDAWTAGLVTKW